jgi:uncharacterized membrane protein (UPF0127 family)
VRIFFLAAVAIAIALATACSDDDSDPTPTPSPVTQTVTARPATASPTVVPTASQAPTPIPLTAVFTNSAGEDIALSIEIADTPEERGVGLMNRESLPEDAGMLFDFGADTNSGFWMRNTLIPLSIAFISSDGEIIHIEDMEPLTEDLHFAPDLYRYAIEVNQGWYGDNEIGVGDTVVLNTG